MTTEGHVTLRLIIISSFIFTFLILLGLAISAEQKELHRHKEAMKEKMENE